MSWWDGFWMYDLNRLKILKKFHIIMLYAQLKQRMYFNKIGAAGLKTNSKSVVKMLNYCNKLMQDHQNILFYFPEGDIRPQNQESLRFEKGIMRIIEQSPENLQLLFVVNLTEYFSNKKPTVFSYYKTVEAKKFQTIRDLEEAYNSFYSDCRNRLNKFEP